MRANDLLETAAARLKAQVRSDSTLPDVVRIFAEFCNTEPGPGFPPAGSDDTVLVQWGTRHVSDDDDDGDYDDREDAFVFDLVRQLMGSGRNRDSTQLHVSVTFAADAGEDLDETDGDFWTDPRVVQRDIEECEVFTALRDTMPTHIKIWVDEI